MIIDLRSDTVTRPSAEMKDFMWSAKVGDDVFNEDPTVNELESYAAQLFGMEAALFCPSGTMTNQIAIKAQTQPGDEIICDSEAHVHYYEGGGIAQNSGVTTNALLGVRGIMTAEQIAGALRPTNVHFPRTSLISVENSTNRGGGKVFPFEELERISELCKASGLAFHMDGARLFNTIICSNQNPTDFGKLFSSISICLSKGLGAPVGSLLIGNKELIQKGRRIRKVFGGGMRQAGFLAAAGIFALKNNIPRMEEDHKLAKEIELLLQKATFVEQVVPVETNIIVFELKEQFNPPTFLKHLETHGILAFEVDKQRIRFVTHMDVPSDSIQTIEHALGYFTSS